MANLACAWADQVYSPFCEWLRVDDRRQQFGGLSWDMGEPLAFVTLLNKVHRIFLHGRPVEPLPEGFLSQVSLPQMISTSALVDFSHYVLDLV